MPVKGAMRRRGRELGKCEGQLFLDELLNPFTFVRLGDEKIAF